MSWNEKKQVLCNQMAAQLEEFFSSYVLVGFDLEGNRVRLSHLPTDRDMDALQQMLEDTVEKDFKVWPTVQVADHKE